ncbi:MAG: hypothetical protein QXV69_07250 [Sulfolobaceae archaeon]
MRYIDFDELGVILYNRHKGTMSELEEERKSYATNKNYLSKNLLEIYSPNT